MTLTVQLPHSLAEVAGSDSLIAEGATVGEVLSHIGAQFPTLGARIRTPTGGLHPFVSVFVDRQDVRRLDGLDTALAEGAKIRIVYAIAGG